MRRLFLIEGLGPLPDDPSRTLARFREATGRRARRRARGLRRFATVDQAVDARVAASGMDPALARPIVERGLLGEDDEYRWSSDPRLTLPTPVRLAESQIRALLAGIAAPSALLLARPQTPYLPIDMLRERASQVGDIAIRFMDGGHHLHMEHPEAVARLLRAHLADHP